MGRSQYFFRTRMNASSSLMKLIMGPSKLTAHRVRSGPRRLPFDPVTRGLPVEAQTQGGLADESHQDPDRCDGREEEQAEDHGARESLEQETEAEPQPIQRCEHSRPCECDEQEADSDPERPASHRLPVNDRPHACQQKDGREDQAEGAIRRATHIMSPSQIFVDRGTRHGAQYTSAGWPGPASVHAATIEHMVPIVDPIEEHRHAQRHSLGALSCDQRWRRHSARKKSWTWLAVNGAGGAGIVAASGVIALITES